MECNLPHVRVQPPNIDCVKLVEEFSPCVAELIRFQVEELPVLHRKVGLGYPVPLPVPCLRWTHDSINAQMVFGSGRRQDSSVYEVVHDLLSERTAPRDLPPLQVVLENGKLYSLSNRRLAALKMFQAIRQHEVIRVPCDIHEPHDPKVRAKFKASKTTSAVLADGLGVLLHASMREAWHMGAPLFRSPNEWCTPPSNISGEETEGEAHAGDEDTVISSDTTTVPPGMNTPPGLYLPFDSSSSIESPTVPATHTRPPHSVVSVSAAGRVAPKDNELPRFKTLQGRQRLLGVWAQRAAASAVDESSRSSNDAQVNIESNIGTEVAPAIEIDVDGACPDVKCAESSQPSPGQHDEVAPMAASSASVGAPKQSALNAATVCRMSCDAEEPLQLASLSTTHRLQGVWAQRAAANMSKDTSSKEILGTFGRPLQTDHDKTKAASSHIPGNAAAVAAEAPAVATAGHLTGSQPLRAKETVFEELADGDAGHLLQPNTQKQGADDDEQHLHVAGPEPCRVSGNCENCGTDSEDDSYRDSDDELEEDEFDDLPDSEVYEDKSALIAEMKGQRGIKRIVDLRGKLVSGTFRCLSGADFQGRRCRGDVLVESGPVALLGCRVHIVGPKNRNHAWHFDKCFVRIFRARVGLLEGESDSKSWDAKMSGRTELFGKVVHSAESGAPRQMTVVCLRSRLVRSPKRMIFRPINGKFPLITVPWEATSPPPSLFHLHIVEILEWKLGRRLIGRHVETLTMKHHLDDSRLLHAVQHSLNFCDWNPGENERLEELLKSGSADDTGPVIKPGSERVDLRSSNLTTVSIEHEGCPASIAFSLVKGRYPQLQVHVVDVNEYLDTENCLVVEKLLRQRAIGAWFTDYLDRPMEACLPFLPKEIEQKSGFQSGADRYAITFSFPVNSASCIFGSTGAKHFFSVVRCDRVCTPVEAESILRGARSNNGTTDVAVQSLLEQLVLHTTKFTARAQIDGRQCALQHFEPDFVAAAPSEDPFAAAFKLRNAISVLTYAVDSYAGRVLARPEVWSALLLPSSQDDEPLEPGMPIRVCCKPDSRCFRGVSRLLCSVANLDDSGDISVQKALQAMKRIVSKKELDVRQKYCLQSAFLRQLQMSYPQSAYLFVTSTQSHVYPTGCDTQLFQREPFFHATAPLRRYIDILGHRALKWAGGWRPSHNFLRPTSSELQDALARTNMRLDALRFACNIYRIITLMREAEVGGWRVENAIIGGVGPASFQVLVPTPAFTQISIQVPVSAIRADCCTTEYVPDEQSLKVSCIGFRNQMLQRSSWVIGTWGSTKVAGIIARNFAQPVPHHAAINSVLLSEVTFEACGGHRVTMGLAHKMFPEVFSSWPDLKEKHLADRDMHAYAKMWHEIKLCQVHAAAVSNDLNATHLKVQSLEWYRSDSNENFRCLIQNLDDALVACGDLVILRCSARRREVVLYGEVVEFFANPTQIKRRLCTNRICTEPNCPFAHSEAEMQPCRFRLQVRLSKVSCETKRLQQKILDAASVRSFDLQLIKIPPLEKKSLKNVQQLPKKSVKASPMSAHLVGNRTPLQKQHEQEVRPLASPEQVKRALSSPEFKVDVRSKKMNLQQLDGIQKGLQWSFSVVQGPPGTGKTTFLVHFVVALLNLETDPTLKSWAVVGNKRRTCQVLVCTPSNQAADEVLARLVSNTTIPHSYITRVYARSIETAHGSKYKGGTIIEGRSDFTIRPGLEEHSLHFKTRSRHTVAAIQTRFSSSGSSENVQQRDYDAIYEREEEEILRNSRVVVATCGGASFHGALSKKGSAPLRFITVIIDEAAQATEPDVVLPAQLAHERVVVVGDHKQLGPVVTEHNLCRAYLNLLETPLLERLYQNPKLLPANTMLDRQYRMHSSICRFPSKQFYDSRLQDDPSIAERPSLQTIWPQAGENVVFVDCPHPHSYDTLFEVGRGRSSTTSVVENNTSLKNLGEAELVLLAYRRLLKSKAARPDEIAVITPYKAQQQEIRRLLLSHFGEASKDTAVGTVYALQGSEREYIILSFVRSTAEGAALLQTSSSSASSDVVVSINERNELVRQTCEAQLGILGNWKLLNVSLTRAKCGLICIGNRTVLSEGSEEFFALSDDLSPRGCVLSEDEFKSLENVRAPQFHTSVAPSLCAAQTRPSTKPKAQQPQTPHSNTHGQASCVAQAGSAMVDAESSGHTPFSWKDAGLGAEEPSEQAGCALAETCLQSLPETPSSVPLEDMSALTHSYTNEDASNAEKSNEEDASTADDLTGATGVTSKSQQSGAGQIKAKTKRKKKKKALHCQHSDGEEWWQEFAEATTRRALVELPQCCRICSKTLHSNTVARSVGLCKTHFREMQDCEKLIQSHHKCLQEQIGSDAGGILRGLVYHLVAHPLVPLSGDHLDDHDKGLAFYECFAHFLACRHVNAFGQHSGCQPLIQLAGPYVKHAPQAVLAIGHAMQQFGMPLGTVEAGHYAAAGEVLKQWTVLDIEVLWDRNMRLMTEAMHRMPPMSDGNH